MTVPIIEPMVETGRSQASADLLGRLAQALDCDMEDIVV